MDCDLAARRAREGGRGEPRIEASGPLLDEDPEIFDDVKGEPILESFVSKAYHAQKF